MVKKGENIYKRKDGRWEGRYVKQRNLEGKIKYGYVYGKKYNEVKKRLLHLKASTRREKSNITYNGLFSDWFLLWMNQYLKKEVKVTTYSIYSNMIHNYMIPYFGKMKMSQLGKKEIQDFIYSLEERNLSSGYIKNLFNLLQKSIKEAEEAGYLDLNITKNIVLPKNKSNSVKALSISEQHQLEKVAFQLSECSATILALYSGMRIGEISGLKWGDIDFENDVIQIKRTVYRVTKSNQQNEKTTLIEGSPKSQSSQRIIPLSKNLKNYLLEKKGVSTGEYVVAYKGKRVEPRTINYRFKTILKNACIKDIHFHSLRHTFATRCLEQGADITSLSRLLGHNSVKLTLDTYTDSMLENRRAVISAVDSLWSTTKNS